MQRCAVALGAAEACLSIIGVPLARTASSRFGEMDAARDREVAGVYECAVRFLSLLCHGNSIMQLMLLESEGVIVTLLGVEGVDMEGLLGEIARDNIQVVDKVGQKWIKLLFTEVIGRYGRRRAHVMEAVCCLMKCSGQAIKDNQARVMAMFRKHDEIVGQFMQGSDEEWDKRIRHVDAPLLHHTFRKRAFRLPS